MSGDGLHCLRKDLWQADHVSQSISVHVPVVYIALMFRKGLFF